MTNDLQSEMQNRIEIELLKKDVVTMAALLEKFDTTIDKMQEIASSLSRMVSLQEQRIESQEIATKEVQSVLEMRRQENNQEIKELHSRITTVNRELSEKIDETERKILQELQIMRAELKGDSKGLGTRLGEIELWKYMVMGAVAVIMFLLMKVIDLSKLF